MLNIVSAAILTTVLAVPVTAEQIVNPTPPSRVALLISRAAVAAQTVSCGTDYGVTMYAMGTGRFHESNPVWAWAERRPVAMGVSKLGICAGVSYALLKEHRKHPKRTALIAGILTAVSVWATVRNARLLRDR